MVDAVENARAAPGWEAVQLQLIAFPTTPAIDIDQRWWRELTGQQPLESVQKTQERIDQGVFDGRLVMLSIDLLRIIWAAAPPFDLERFSKDPFQSTGPFAQSYEWFDRFLSRWLTENPPAIKRLGFSAKLFQRVADRISGYQMLGKYLPTVQVDPESTDFLYRINRKRTSRSDGVTGLPINRISTWSVVLLTSQVEVRLPGVTELGVSAPNERMACVLDLDINTAVERKEALPREALRALFAELVSFAVEIAERGDVP